MSHDPNPLELKPITWNQLKKFVNSIPEEKINQVAYILIEDETLGRPLLQPFITEEDVYSNIEDAEDSGTLHQLKELHGEDFIESDYVCNTEKGTPFLWVE